MMVRYASARYGWLANYRKDKDEKTQFVWTKYKAGAMLLPPERQDLIDEIHAALYGAGIMHDVVEGWK